MQISLRIEPLHVPRYPPIPVVLSLQDRSFCRVLHWFSLLRHPPASVDVQRAIEVSVVFFARRERRQLRVLRRTINFARTIVRISARAPRVDLNHAHAKFLGFKSQVFDQHAMLEAVKPLPLVHVRTLRPPAL